MDTKLYEYNKKRNFEKTEEPEGKSGTQENGLKFVIQHHIARRDHFDLRLEWDGVLLSWAVPKGPSYNTRDKRLAIKVEDHPLEYRNFEGTIPKGEYGGGTVMLWDEGYWEPQSDVKQGLNEGSLKFILKGRRLKGKWALIRMKSKPGDNKDNWLLLKDKDDYAKDTDGISKFDTSIRTERTMDEIKEGKAEKTTKNPFNKADVQLAKLLSTVPKGDDWLYEVKYDGYRIVAYIEGNNVRLLTRNGHDYTVKFNEIAISLRDFAANRSMVMDGEMVIVDEQGKTDFQALQNYLKQPKGKSLTYMIFDLLAIDGLDLRNRPLTYRKEMLMSIMEKAPNNLQYSQHINGKGEESLLAACKLDLEGIIGKKANSIYSGTRNGDWIKLKCDKRQEFVIGGYTLSDKKTSGLSSLLLGVYENSELIYVGRAGTGFNALNTKELQEKFRNIKRKTSPFIQAPKSKTNEEINWLEPTFVAEIKFAEWTEENLLRQASYKGLRTDKDPKQVTREDKKDIELNEEIERTHKKDLEINSMKTNNESIIIGGIKITHPDKVIFEEENITKADVVSYYEKVSKRMLPYVSNRILSIVRCPKGISESCFYKKHPGKSSKGIITIPITNSDGKEEDYFYIENTEGLIYEAQMGTLEFHTWGSKADNLEKPDIMVFDLDPDEGMNLDKVRKGVRDLKSLLDELSLISFLKTSGGKGYHIVVPFNPSVSWDTFHDFSRRIAEVMEQKWPEEYTSNVRKEKRKNKTFIDWIRNGKGATSIAPYSLRARKGAKVSMPIKWEELDTIAPNGISMADSLKRVESEDPWKDFFSIDQKLKL